MTRNSSVIPKIKLPKTGLYYDENNDRDSKRSFGVRLQKRTFDKQKGKCKKCGRKLNVSHMEFHHVKSWSKGGRTTSNNCIGICHECHKDIHDEEKIKEDDKKRKSKQKDSTIYGKISPIFSKKNRFEL